MFGMIRNSLFGNSEETEYKVLSSETKNGVRFEVRRYDAAKYAAISSEGRTYDQVIGELVRKLLTYIGGNNEQGSMEKYKNQPNHNSNLPNINVSCSKSSIFTKAMCTKTEFYI
ncbi:hypothetical protein ILYODFUR_002393 [Ilyodon furcidens]|uniref:Uncharacterized protein n=1 Tax=Ilyodon furcidens TaxID=33524 RepID=A0ABV0VDR7_9TELE